MGRNTTGPPCSVGRPPPTRPAAGTPTVHAPRSQPARPLAALQTTTASKAILAQAGQQ